MVLRVVEVLMLQVPASSVMSIWGVDTVAAFLSRKLTSRACNQNIVLTKCQHQQDFHHLEELLVLLGGCPGVASLEGVHLFRLIEF